jgi:large subunit ribosomal protein L18
MRKQIGKIKNESDKRRYRRRLSIRSKIVGTTERPRICAFRSNKHITVQVIDDSVGKTLFSVQTFGKNSVPEGKPTREGVKVVGSAVAAKMKEANLNQAVFDRAGYKYTGVIATLVDSIRENGIQV